MEQLFDIIFNNFDFAYMIVINILTYIIIKIIDILNKDKTVSTNIKRVCLLCSIVLVTICYLYIGYENKLVLVNSAILSPVFYSWVLRPILVKLKIGYKQIDKDVDYEKIKTIKV